MKSKIKWNRNAISMNGQTEDKNRQDMIIDNESTICAISTPAGVGGIAVARVSGANAFVILSKIWKGCDLETARTHTAHLGDIVDPEQPDVRLDQAVVTLFRAPHSFTGENVAEISIHGSTWIQSELIRLLIDAGCRMAEPGEFSQRAFASGRIILPRRKPWPTLSHQHPEPHTE